MRGTTRSPRVAAAVAALATLVALTLPAAAATRAVRVGSFYFDDATRGDGQVVVTQGDRITFTFEGKNQHTATVDGLFNSGTKSPGQRYTTPLLTRVGTFTLYCQIHGAPRHVTVLSIRRRPSPAPSPTRAQRSPAPTPAKTPAPPPASAARSPTPRPSPSPSASASASPKSSPSPTPRPSPAARPTSPAPPSGVAHPATAAGAAPPDVVPAGPLDDSGSSWLLPGVLLLLVAGGAGAIALGRRRR
ncbi:MAG: hypothetical protein QOJ79_3193 [Actinomycetota bacterium]|jgi:plastocyanin|nr:hypothetical protein [Actinomycetota bacterium]